MTNIEKIGLIKLENLSGEHYFQSVLEQGYETGLLSDLQIEQIQFACLALLAKKTDKYNGGDSSSIPTEKAQELLASIFFTIGVQLKSYTCPDDAVTALLNDGLESIYISGRKRIDRLLMQAKICHGSLMSHLLETKNIFYSSTIIDGIKGFFKLYYPDFFAQEIHITADYPVYNQKERLLGIEFIKQYLEQLYFENAFCTLFSGEDINCLHCGYDAHHEGLLFNLYEPVLAAALGCVIVGTDPSQLNITRGIQDFLYCKFAEKPSSEILEILKAALEELSRLFSFTEGLMTYVKDSLPQLAATIESATKTDNLERVFIVPKIPQNLPNLTVSYGQRMEDELYCKVLSDFMESQNMANKINIMKAHVHSLSDLNDLLLDAELTVDETVIILNSLAPPEIAALMKRNTDQYDMSFTELRDCEKTLCEGLNIFVSTLPPEQQEMLKKAVEVLEIE